MRKPERQIIPYRAKVVEPISLLPYEERVRRIEACGNNLFRLGSHEVYIDLITDSGTGALSIHQMGRMMIGDEAYAGSRSFFEMERQIRESMGYRYAIPVHQGRAGERVFDFVLIKKHMIVPGNSHFDTTKAHIEFAGGRAIDCTIDAGRTSEGYHPFKGNIDLERVAFSDYGLAAMSHRSGVLGWHAPMPAAAGSLPSSVIASAPTLAPRPWLRRSVCATSSAAQKPSRRPSGCSLPVSIVRRCFPSDSSNLRGARCTAIMPICSCAHF